MQQQQTPTNPQSLQTPNFDYLNNHNIRRALAKDFRWFCMIYLSHHFEVGPASFHEEMMKVLSDHSINFLEVVGFRGSAKSTFGSLALPLWCGLEHPDLYPFIIPLSDTSVQSKMNMSNIKSELDNNVLIKQDYGTIKF